MKVSGIRSIGVSYSDRTRDQEEKLLDRYRDPNDPLKILIVTAKLLTGFDAPILQAMYLDKPLKDHTLLQAICRTNRTYGSKKTHGLIVDSGKPFPQTPFFSSIKPITAGCPRSMYQFSPPPEWAKPLNSFTKTFPLRPYETTLMKSCWMLSFWKW